MSNLALPNFGHLTKSKYTCLVYFNLPYVRIAIVITQKYNDALIPRADENQGR